MTWFMCCSAKEAISAGMSHPSPYWLFNFSIFEASWAEWEILKAGL
jgi:hypothetical protein